VLVVDAVYQALLDAGVPDTEVARVERMISTFVLGYAISETGGRFDAGDPRERRALLNGTDLPAHRRLASRLERATSSDAEFETDMDDLVRLVERLAGLS
jgi:Tetracyclin repressor-like, C-terminal domain